MLRLCREKASARNLAPVLYRQLMQRMDIARRYVTIFVPYASFTLMTDLDDAGRPSNASSSICRRAAICCSRPIFRAIQQAKVRNGFALRANDLETSKSEEFSLLGVGPRSHGYANQRREVG